jgi:hypothetical protein
MPIADLVQIDVERQRRFERLAETSTWAEERRRAQRHLVAIERRRLRYVWSYIDPHAPGALIQFASDHDREKCVAWLKSEGWDLDGLSPVTVEPVSACCTDRCLWAAFKYLIKKNITKAHAIVKIKRAHESDRRWHAKRAKAEAAALKAAE